MGKAQVETEDLKNFYQTLSECCETINDVLQKLGAGAKMLENSWKDEGYQPLGEAIDKISEKLLKISEQISRCAKYLDQKEKKAEEYLA